MYSDSVLCLWRVLMLENLLKIIGLMIMYVQSNMLAVIV